MYYALLFLLGGFGYMLKASCKDDKGLATKILGIAAPGTRLGRLMFWCMPLAVWLTLATANPWMLPVILIASYLGVMLGYLKGEFDLAKKKNRNGRNYAWLTLRGVLTALPIVFALEFMKHHGWYNGDTGYLALVGGALFVPCYLAGVWLDKRVSIRSVGYADIGAFLCGGAVVLGIGASL